MNNLKIKGYDNLEKDPENGAVILSQNYNNRNIQLNNLIKRVKNIEKQNEEILQLLRNLSNK